MTGADILKRHDTMNDYVTSNWMNIWQEMADWAWPTNDNINRVRVSGQEKPPQRLTDTCIEANFNFATGFFSHLFPPNTVWAKFKHPQPKTMDSTNVADYFERVSRTVHEVMISSNFAQEEFQSLLGMGALGTSCMSCEEDDKSVVRFRNYIISKVRIAENYKGEVDTISREFELDARQAIQQFGEEALVAAGMDSLVIDAEQGEATPYKFVHMVCPRADFDKSKKNKKNKPIASFYVSREGESIVSEGGFDYLPYKVARFSTGNGEVYGRGPMSMKLGTARRTNVIYRSLVIAAEQQANAQWLVADDDAIAKKTITSRAGAIIKYRASSPGGKPERLPPNGDASMAMDIYKMHDEEIRRMFFNHLFRPLEDYRNMTAYEVSERQTAVMMTLAPFVSRYIEEKVSPIMEYVYYLCQKRGLLPEPPIELQESPEYEIEYVGRLALATKDFEVMGAIQTIRVFGELGQASPKILRGIDNVDEDDLFRQAWYAKSSSMNALKKPKDVDEERMAAAEAAQQQQQIDNMAPMADAAQKMSGAVDPTSAMAQMEKGG